MQSDSKGDKTFRIYLVVLTVVLTVVITIATFLTIQDIKIGQM